MYGFEVMSYIVSTPPDTSGAYFVAVNSCLNRLSISRPLGEGLPSYMNVTTMNVNRSVLFSIYRK